MSLILLCVKVNKILSQKLFKTFIFAIKVNTLVILAITTYRQSPVKTPDIKT